MMIARWFNNWIPTDPNSVHHGAPLEAGGTAIDENGNIYAQVVTDRGWWEWHWEKTGAVAAVPRALRNAFKDLKAAKSGLKAARNDHEQAKGLLIEAARRDPATSWWPEGATPWSLSDKEVATAIAERLEKTFRRELNLEALVRGLVWKVNRIAHEKGLI